MVLQWRAHPDFPHGETKDRALVYQDRFLTDGRCRMRDRWWSWLPGQSRDRQKQSFLGYMFYNRFWFQKDRDGLTRAVAKSTTPEINDVR
jgi:hypothetical protein